MEHFLSQFHKEPSPFSSLDKQVMQPKEIYETIPEGLKENTLKFEYFKGMRFRFQGKFAEALLCYEAALRFDAKHVGSRVNIGVCMMKLGRVSDAVRNFKIALEYTTGVFELWYNLALCYIFMKKFGKALKAVEKAFKNVDEQFHYYLTKVKAFALYR